MSRKIEEINTDLLIIKIYKFQRVNYRSLIDRKKTALYTLKQKTFFKESIESCISILLPKHSFVLDELENGYSVIISKGSVNFNEILSEKIDAYVEKILDKIDEFSNIFNDQVRYSDILDLTSTKEIEINREIDGLKLKTKLVDKDIKIENLRKKI